LVFALTKLQNSLYKNLAKTFFIGKNLVYLPSCHSTNDIASGIVKNDPFFDGTVVVTNNQTAGKGQQGNTWESNASMNLTFSMILKMKHLLLKDHFMLNVISSLAIVDFIKKKSVANVKVKWPNDIYVDDHKIAGVLISNSIRSNLIDSSIIGIGFNVNQVEFETKMATSLKLQTGGHYLLGESLEQLILYFEKRYFELIQRGKDELLEDYQRQLYWKDQIHTYRAAGQYLTGIIKGINEEGKLFIESENENYYFNFKEVEFVK